MLETPASTCYGDTCTSMSTVALLTIAKLRNMVLARCPVVEEWSGEGTCGVQAQWDCLSSKNEVKVIVFAGKRVELGMSTQN